MKATTTCKDMASATAKLLHFSGRECVLFHNVLKHHVCNDPSRERAFSKRDREFEAVKEQPSNI